MDLLWIFLTALPAAFLLTVLLCKLVIPALRARRIGQHIFSEYVTEHRGKEGTPTMGGICFIAPILLLIAIYALARPLHGGQNLIPLALAVLLAAVNAAIGFFDDVQKLSHKENAGLKSWQKFVLQLMVAVLYLWAMVRFCGLDTVVKLPILDQTVDLGIFYYFVALIVIVGVINSVNLTDGIDGLASSVTVVAAMGLALMSFMLADRGGVLIGALLMGGAIGFLVYNFHPAKVFMGDTGSLFLGGMLIGAGFMMDEVIPMLLLCMVFILDMLSSLIQIISIRLFHRKVFRIAPVHHQFQQMMWSEERIVYVFSAVGLLFGAAGVLVALCG